MPTDGEALAIGSEASEAAVVEVTWSDRAHRVATLRVHLAGRRRWLGRTLGFTAADVDAERGRTIGLTLASMLPDAEPAPPAPRETPAPPEIVAPPPAHARPAPEIAERPAPDLAPSPLHYALELFGTGAAGLGSSVQTGGGGAAFETFVTPRFGVRIGGSVRMGDVGGAGARTLALLGTAGLELRAWPSSKSSPFGASLRADYVLMNQDRDPPVRRGRRPHPEGAAAFGSRRHRRRRLGSRRRRRRGAGCRPRRDVRDDLHRHERNARGDPSSAQRVVAQGACVSASDTPRAWSRRGRGTVVGKDVSENPDRSRICG